MATYALLVTDLALVTTPQALALGGSCTNANVPKCDDTCSAQGYCLSDRTWVLAADCPSGQVCFNNDTSAICAPANGTSCSGSDSGSSLPNITCLGTGLFPNLNDTTRFYNCTEMYGNGIASKCPSGYSFDSCNRVCQRGSSWASTTVVCTGNKTEGVAPYNNGLHYSCAEGSTRETWSACPYGQQYSIMDKACFPLPGCVWCNKSSNLPYPGSTCQYVWCFVPGYFQIRSCNKGYRYDPYSTRCVQGVCS